MDNAQIASAFERLADLLEIEGANPFRVQAYRNAARYVGGHAKSMADLLAQGRDLSEMPYIGKELANKIVGLVETGELPALVKVEARVPGGLADLVEIEGLGPKRVRTLYKELGITGRDDLRRALESGQVAALAGFGKATVERIAAALSGAGPENA